MSTVAYIIVALLIVVPLYLFLWALCTVASDADDAMEQWYRERCEREDHEEAA